MSTGYTANTPSRYMFNPARVYQGNTTTRKLIPTRGGVTATETRTMVMPEVDGVQQPAQGNMYKAAHGLVIAFAAVEVDQWLQDLINDGQAGVTTVGDTVWTPRPNFQLYPVGAYVTDLRILGDVQGTVPAFFGYHIPLAYLSNHQIQYGASGEATVQLEFTACVPSASDPRTTVPFTRIQRDDLTF